MQLPAPAQLLASVAPVDWEQLDIPILARPSEEERRHEKLCEFSKGKSTPLTKSAGPFISQGLLRKYGIEVHDLDFVTGMPSHGGKQVLNPTPSCKIEKCLRLTRPWDGGGDLTDFKNCSWNSNIAEAQHLYQIIRRYLTTLGLEDGKQPGLLSMTPWKPFMNNYRPLRQSKRGWEAQDIWRYTMKNDKNEVVGDPSVPHMFCFVASEPCLVEGEVSIGEMATIVSLPMIYASHYRHLPHRPVPVTLISCSWRMFRVVQGIVNIDKSHIEIRMTPIMSFVEGIKSNWLGFLTLLGWIISNPVGKAE
ncbi:unnamed protein product [Clonostachys rosea f. rosea IK726]|uniref:Uncharacterized protein n=1 Tax=Clonostachys rosea f. rosea IK726 TaxID=1349383 RepID=A0ACA9TWQ6_BIOOC|nr:unnamed protein product [Clonostachys rosea f. rosea IK726]